MSRILGLAFLAAGAVCAQSVAGIAEVGFKVSDMAKARAFYEGVLGLKGDAAAANGTVRMRVNECQSVLLQPGLAADEKVRMTHLTLDARDLRGLRAKLAKKGLKITKGVGGAFSVTEPEGVKIAFTECKSAGVTGGAISGHLQHMGVNVPMARVAESEKFWKDVMGFEEFWRYSPDGKLRLIKYVAPGPRRDIVELMIYEGELTRDRIGSNNHINFEVNDIHAAYRYVRERGVGEDKRAKPVVNAEDIWVFNLYDPDGSRVEVQDLRKIGPVKLTEEKVNNRDAYVMDNGLIRVAVLKGGGHIAEARLVTGDSKKDVNPMRVPHYPTIDPMAYVPSRDDAIYGDTPHKWLSAGYMGHLLCFPFYGPPSSDDEAKAGLGNHGEAPIVEWTKIREERDAAGTLTLWYGADLKRTGWRVERAVILARGVKHVRVREFVENLSNQDKTVNWMQHATFGPPFIEQGKNVMYFSGSDEARQFTSQEKTGSYEPFVLDAKRGEHYFVLENPGLPLLVGYTFPAEGNRWLADWQENKRSTVLPWNGQVVARGIEFGSTPYAEGLKKSVERGEMRGVPAFRWIGAKQKAETEFTIVLEEKPAGFEGVRDLKMVYGAPVFSYGKPEKAAVGMKDFAFMEGSWVGEIDGGLMEEHWSMPDEAGATGWFRLTMKGQPVFYEFMTIEQTENGPRVFLRHINKRGVAREDKTTPIEFRVKSAARNEIRLIDSKGVELLYRLEGSDRLVAELLKDGKKEEFIYKRRY